jgi:hypothetical protein
MIIDVIEYVIILYGKTRFQHTKTSVFNNAFQIAAIRDLVVIIVALEFV